MDSDVYLNMIVEILMIFKIVIFISDNYHLIHLELERRKCKDSQFSVNLKKNGYRKNEIQIISRYLIGNSITHNNRLKFLINKFGVSM